MEKKRNSTARMRLMCAIIFVVFTYLYLSCYQENVLAVAQHVLSQGLTSYNYTLYPLLTTLVLFLLQLSVYAATRVRKAFHALTYFPSMLILAFITDVSCDIDVNRSVGAWGWIIPVSFLLFAGVIWVIRQLEPYEPDVHSGLWLSKRTWQNLLQMLTMMFLVILISNGNVVFHERCKMERLMMEGKYDKALEVGKGTLESDSSLTMLRVACLHHTGCMGDQLFTYPLVGGSKAMMPDGVTTKSLMWKVPKWMQRDRKGKVRYRQPLDYQLCALLMNKDLDGFVAEVQRCYKLTSDSLPRHYKEALILYTHRRAHPKWVYFNNVMEADFQDYQALERKYSNPMERKAALHDTYGNTYWYYYQYVRK